VEGGQIVYISVSGHHNIKEGAVSIVYMKSLVEGAGGRSIDNLLMSMGWTHHRVERD
jgi:hypothetical protein